MNKPESWRELINVSDQITYQAAYLSAELRQDAHNSFFFEKIIETANEMERLSRLARHHAELMLS